MKNKLYKIATTISGEELDNGLVRSGAKNDFYYDECRSEEEKLDQIKAIAENVVECSVTQEEAEIIMNYLDADFEDSSAHYYALEALFDK